MHTSVVIPVYNGEKTIAQTINALKDISSGWEIIVVDDGSTDNTFQTARETGVTVLRHNKNMGKGKALTTGCSMISGDFVVLIDADLGASAREILKLLDPVINKEADVAVAKFPPSPVAGGFGFVKRLAHYGIYVLTGHKTATSLSGQRVMSRQVLDTILPFADGYGVEVAATIDIIKGGWRIKEVEVVMEHNFSHRNIAGFKHRGRQFYEILKVLCSKGYRRLRWN